MGALDIDGGERSGGGSNNLPKYYLHTFNTFEIRLHSEGVSVFVGLPKTVVALRKPLKACKI